MWSLRVFLSAPVLALTLASAPVAAERVTPSSPMKPETRAAVKQLLDARRSETKRTDVYARIGLAVRELRRSLRAVIATGGTPEGAEHAEKAKAAVLQIKALLADARRGAARERATLQRLGAVERRVDELVARTEEIGRASGNAQRQSAKTLLTELDVDQPRSERLNPGRRRDSAWRTRRLDGAVR
jgi:hypothetical protein